MLKKSAAVVIFAPFANFLMAAMAMLIFGRDAFRPVIYPSRWVQETIASVFSADPTHAIGLGIVWNAIAVFVLILLLVRKRR